MPASELLPATEWCCACIIGCSHLQTAKQELKEAKEKVDEITEKVRGRH